MSSECIETMGTPSKPRETTTQRDIRREKRLLRQAIAASSGNHRIRLQRELAALEDYERETRQRTMQLAALP